MPVPRLTHNILYNLLGQSCILIISLITVKSIYQVLGEDVLGIFYFTQFITFFITVFFDKSLRISIIREIASDSQLSNLCNYLRTWSLLTWGSFTLLSTIIYLFSPLIAHYWINTSTVEQDTVVTLLRIQSIAALITFLRSFYNSILQGKQYIGVNNAIDIGYQLLQQGGLVLIIKLGANASQASYWILGCSMLGVLATFIAVWYYIGGQALIPGYFPEAISKGASFSKKLMLAVVFSTFHKNIDRLIISKILPIGILGQYGVISSLLAKANLPLDSFSRAAYPVMCGVKQDRKAFLSLFDKLSDITWFISIPVFSLLIYISIPLMTYIFDVKTAYSLLMPYYFLLIGYYLSALVTIPWLFSLAAGHAHITTKANFWAMVIFTPITCIAVWFFSLNGAGIAWVLYNVFYLIYSVPKICTLSLEMPTNVWYNKLLKTSIIGSSPYIIAFSLLWLTGNTSFYFLLIMFFTSSLVFAFISWHLLGKELRSVLVTYLPIRRKFC